MYFEIGALASVEERTRTHTDSDSKLSPEEEPTTRTDRGRGGPIEGARHFADIQSVSFDTRSPKDVDGWMGMPLKCRKKDGKKRHEYGV